MADGNLNWVRNLEFYQQLYNTCFHTALGMSPYECYVGTKRKKKATDANCDIKRRRQEVHNNDMKATLKMKEHYNAKKQLSQYLVGEAIFIRDRPRGKIGKRDLTRPKVVEGKLVETSQDQTRLKVNVDGETKWVSVKNVTSITHDKEKRRKKITFRMSRDTEDFEQT